MKKDICLGCGKEIFCLELNICKDCEENYIYQVSQYAREVNKNASIEELIANTEVPEKVLRYFDKNGFLDYIKYTDHIVIGLDKPKIVPKSEVGPETKRIA